MRGDLPMRFSSTRSVTPLPVFSAITSKKGLGHHTIGVRLGKGLNGILLVQHPSVEDSLRLEVFSQPFENSGYFFTNLGVDSSCVQLGPEIRVQLVLSCSE